MCDCLHLDDLAEILKASTSGLPESSRKTTVLNYLLAAILHMQHPQPPSDQFPAIPPLAESSEPVDHLEPWRIEVEEFERLVYEE